MSKNLVYTIIGIIILILIVLGALWYTGDKSKNSPSGSTSGYSAIFLSNGQVYFGKLKKPTSEWAELSDIYYLQVTQQKNLQPKDENADSAQAQNKLSLVKLGNELHGPKDQMTINNKHILFWEALKDDGKVVQSIKKYVEDQANGVNPEAQTPASTKTELETNTEEDSTE